MTIDLVGKAQVHHLTLNLKRKKAHASNQETVTGLKKVVIHTFLYYKHPLKLFQSLRSQLHYRRTQFQFLQPQQLQQVLLVIKILQMILPTSVLSQDVSTTLTILA